MLMIKAEIELVVTDAEYTCLDCTGAEVVAQWV